MWRIDLPAAATPGTYRLVVEGVGCSLDFEIADGFHQHIAKGSIHFAMGFSVFVEMLNLKMRSRRAPVTLRRGARLEDDRG